MNNQEAFNRIAEHLTTQNARALNSAQTSCRYRSPTGLKCAIGALIPDDQYREDMEGKTIETLLEGNGELRELFDGVNHALLRRLQFVHDAYHPSNWKLILRRVAFDFNLKRPECIDG